MIQDLAKIIWNKKIGPSYFHMGIKCEKGFENAKPGQFVMLCAIERTEAILRRPFSIHRLITKKGKVKGIEILYKVVGKCTKRFSEYQADNFIDLLGPLGNGFIFPSTFKHIFIVAGGIGVAPMVFLSSAFIRLKPENAVCDIFLGGKTKTDLLCLKDFAGFGLKTHISTDDGSAGNHGFITQTMENSLKIQHPDIIFGCGPKGMLKSLTSISEKHGIPCQISIETIMACGMGACLGCAIEHKNDKDMFLHACMNGPVFDAETISL